MEQQQELSIFPENSLLQQHDQNNVVEKMHSNKALEDSVTTSCNNILSTKETIVKEISSRNKTDELQKTELITDQSDEINQIFNELDEQKELHLTESVLSNDLNLGKAVDVTANQDGGVIKQILKFGNDDSSPGYGDKVYVRYVGYLHVGKSFKPFDKSEEKVYFHLGRGAVIKGLDYGIATMKKNEVALFIIQPEYAYGNLGSPPSIPPYAVLFFEVELYEWKLEDLSPQKDESILRKIIQKGEGLGFPNDGAHVKAKIVGYYNGLVFEDRDVEFLLGEGYNIGIPEAIETSLFKFRLHEKSVLYLKAQYAFELKEKIQAALPPDAIVEYEVTLEFFEKAKEVWEMNTDEKYEKSLEAKAKGNDYFQVGNYKLALKQFKKIITYLENEPGVTPELGKSRQVILIAAYLNISLCYMKMENFVDAIKMCDKVLVKDCKNEKALYRRGQCRLAINDFEEALEDFRKLLQINPNNKACKSFITTCCTQINEQKVKDRQVYGNMFQKFVDQDEEERKRRALKTETGVWEKNTGNLSEKEDCSTVVKLLV